MNKEALVTFCKNLQSYVKEQVPEIVFSTDKNPNMFRIWGKTEEERMVFVWRDSYFTFSFYIDNEELKNKVQDWILSQDVPFLIEDKKENRYAATKESKELLNMIQFLEDKGFKFYDKQFEKETTCFNRVFYFRFNYQTLGMDVFYGEQDKLPLKTLKTKQELENFLTFIEQEEERMKQFVETFQLKVNNIPYIKHAKEPKNEFEYNMNFLLYWEENFGWRNICFFYTEGQKISFSTDSLEDEEFQKNILMRLEGLSNLQILKNKVEEIIVSYDPYAYYYKENKLFFNRHDFNGPVFTYKLSSNKYVVKGFKSFKTASTFDDVLLELKAYLKKNFAGKRLEKIMKENDKKEYQRKLCLELTNEPYTCKFKYDENEISEEEINELVAAYYKKKFFLTWKWGNEIQIGDFIFSGKDSWNIKVEKKKG